MGHFKWCWAFLSNKIFLHLYKRGFLLWCFLFFQSFYWDIKLIIIQGYHDNPYVRTLLKADRRIGIKKFIEASLLRLQIRAAPANMPLEGNFFVYLNQQFLLKYIFLFEEKYISAVIRIWNWGYYGATRPRLNWFLGNNGLGKSHKFSNANEVDRNTVIEKAD